MKAELANLKHPQEPPSAFHIFENKMFNQVKLKMPHLPSRDIYNLISSKWRHGIASSERSEYERAADEAN